MLTVEIEAENAGTADWTAGSVTLVYGGDPSFAEGDLALGADTASGARGTFSGTLRAPMQPGRFVLSWQAEADGEAFGPMIDAAVEVTCSDGVFCNGVERFAGGACVEGSDPCDDGQACTTDRCDEASGRCSRTLGADCASCRMDCEPECTGRSCGPDGCGGTCGDCAADSSCALGPGMCRPVSQPGTCANPLPLLPMGTTLVGRHLVAGDTSSDAIHQLVPNCNDTSTAVELVYTFTTTERLGLDVRSIGYDTVLFLRTDCTDDTTPAATVSCSDDSSPPGDYGSRLAVALDPGTYFLVVDGFDDTQLGPFVLDLRFVADGCVPACDGRYCGGDDGCGGDCGTCEDGLSCVDGRCVMDPCVPACDGRECGDDGCGGECGTCSGGELCVPATGTCDSFPECDHDRPTCTPACGDDAFCGTDCACHPVAGAMPDLVIDATRLHDEVIFEDLMVAPDSCAIVEECVGGTGMRRLLRFSVEAVNQGTATLFVPPPPERPDLFQYSACHEHFHYQGFARYELVDSTGAVVLTGRKQAYCMEDTQQVLPGPDVGCVKVYSCDEQGIQAGWSDLYGNALDCQWLDVTGLPAGDYILRVEVNPGRAFEELSFENNIAEVPVAIE
ncbi:MAG: hypothetical protein IT379_08385 [Deltaproteobacteria bacterium]|nr:hypothetical protein [Deltaproteobacteria bacterium]